MAIEDPWVAAEQFARLAVELQNEPDVEHTVDRVVEFAVNALACDHAGLMLMYGASRVESVATTDRRVEEADQLQLATGEGPCLAALPDELTGTNRRGSMDLDRGVYVIADTATDERWPTWGPRVAELGLRNVLSIRLSTQSQTVGALNMYSSQPGWFDAEDAALGQLLAHHAAVALAQAQEHHDLWQAIDSRHLIGQAQGLLMERYDLTAEQAFAALRRYSQDHNIKLRKVAEQLVTTRSLPDQDP